MWYIQNEEAIFTKTKSLTCLVKKKYFFVHKNRVAVTPLPELELSSKSVLLAKSEKAVFIVFIVFMQTFCQTPYSLLINNLFPLVWPKYYFILSSHFAGFVSWSWIQIAGR